MAMISALLPRTASRLRVLLLGAHSDDIEIGCGGTVLQLRRLRRRADFRWVVFSAIGARADEALGGARSFLGPADWKSVV